MSDEMIQQQKSGVGAHALTGGVLGAGAGTYLALGKPTYYGYQTKPKYTSFEDIIKDADDSFTKNMEGVEEAVVNDAKALRDAAKNAGEQYDAELNAFVEANKDGLKELPVDNDVAKELKAAEDAYKAKYDAEVAKLKGTPAVDTAVEQKAVSNVPVSNPNLEREIAGRKAQIERFKGQLSGAEAKLKTQQAAFEEMSKDFQTFANNMADAVNDAIANKRFNKNSLDSFVNIQVQRLEVPKNWSAEQVAAFREAKAKELSAYILELANVRDINAAGAVTGDSSAAIKKLERSLESARNIINETVNSNEPSAVERFINAKTKKLDRLNSFKAKYEEFAAKSTKSEQAKVLQIIELYNKRGGYNGYGVMYNEMNSEAKNIVDEFMNGLEKSDREYLNNMLKLEKNKGKELSDVLKESISETEVALNDVQKAQNIIKETPSKIERLRSQKPVHYEEPKFELPKPEALKKAENDLSSLQGKIKKAEETLAERMKATAQPVKQEVKTVVKSVGAISEEEIADRAKLACEKELNALNIAKENAAKEVEKLGTNKLSVEDLTKAFVEKNGSKEDAIKNATKEFESKTKSLFEKGKLNTWKTAGWIAGGAAAMAVLFALMAPKKKDA